MQFSELSGLSDSKVVALAVSTHCASLGLTNTIREAAALSDAEDVLRAGGSRAMATCVGVAIANRAAVSIITARASGIGLDNRRARSIMQRRIEQAKRFMQELHT